MTLLPYLEAFEWLWSWMKRKPKPTPVPPDVQPRALNILVVEDNASDSFLIAEQLKYCGQTAEFAQDAEGARALIRADNLDVIFVDLRLTHMQGWELIPLIWQQSPHSLVVVVCGEISDIIRIPKPHHMMVVLPKPVNTDDLCALFERIKPL